MGKLFMIYNYLEVTPQEFFDTETSNPILNLDFTEQLHSFTNEEMQLILALLNRMNG